MKQLPNEQELAELVEMARVAAQKAREMSELATEIAQKTHKRVQEFRQAAIENKRLD